MSFEILGAFVVFGVLFAIALIGFTASLRASARNNASTMQSGSTYNPGNHPRDTQRIER